MGPLWAWVILWLVSTYGLVLLLRRALARTAVEPVSVLVATPKPVEPTPEEAPPEPALEGERPAEETELSAAVPAEAEGEPVPEFVTEEGVLERVVPPAEAIEEPPLDPSEPWIREKDEPLTSEPWSPEKEEGTADAPWIQEKEGHEAGEPWIREPEESLSIASAGAEADAPDETEPVPYRPIDLETLTLGLAATEVQELYGLPGHLSKLGEDGEQWRYHLNATDEQGSGVEGVLVLEFQRGRLVSKALEENDADD